MTKKTKTKKKEEQNENYLQNKFKHFQIKF